MKLGLRQTVLTVASLNLIYFVVEFYFGRKFASVALLSDSIDFLEDASVNFLIAIAIGWSLRKRQLVSYGFVALLLIPGVTFLWNAIQKLLDPQVPQGEGMGLVALGALVINFSCALLIARHRKEEVGLVSAAYFSARNDAIANVLIISAGLITLFWSSIVPDFIIGIVIFLLNADAAKKVFATAKQETENHQP